MDIRDLDGRFVVKAQIPYSRDPGDFIIPCRRGHLFGGEAGGLGLFLQFTTRRHKTLGMRKLPWAAVRQEGDWEVVAFIPDAHLEDAYRVLHPHRRRAHKGAPTAAGTTNAVGLGQLVMSEVAR